MEIRAIAAASTDAGGDEGLCRDDRPTDREGRPSGEEKAGKSSLTECEMEETSTGHREVPCVKEENKGARGMPRLLEAKKDVTSCEKLRGGANGLGSGDIRMGEPAGLRVRHSADAEGERRELKHLSSGRRREQQ